MGCYSRTKIRPAEETKKKRKNRALPLAIGGGISPIKLLVRSQNTKPTLVWFRRVISTVKFHGMMLAYNTIKSKERGRELVMRRSDEGQQKIM